MSEIVGRTTAEREAALASVWPMTGWFARTAELLKTDVQSLTDRLLHTVGQYPVTAGKRDCPVCRDRDESFDVPDGVIVDSRAEAPSGPCLKCADSGKVAAEALVYWLPSTGFDGSIGPVRERSAMIIGKAPGSEEIRQQRNFCGRAGELLAAAAADVGLDLRDFYVGNAVRFLPPGDKVENQHVKDCGYLLGLDIARVRPRYLLLLGADAVKAVCGKNVTLSQIRSQPIGFSRLEDLGKPPSTAIEDSELVVFATIHPAAVLREGGLEAGFRQDLRLFKQLLAGGAVSSSAEASDYRIVRDAAALRVVVDEVLREGHTQIAVDCEWGGGSYLTGRLRTIQFSWKAGSACVVRFLEPGGVSACGPVESFALINELYRLFQGPKVELIGHNFRADAKWLEAIGLPVMERFSFDTLLCDHILNENAEHGLESCSVRYTSLGRYDLPVAKWLQANGYKARGAKLRERGYWDIPDELLLPYAAADADCTWRVAKVLKEQLQHPANAGPARCFYEVVMPANHPILEMEMAGFAADQERMAELTSFYVGIRTGLLKEVRELLGKPTFNPRSYLQKTKLLFDPVGRGGLELVPYKTTEKPARMWDDLIRKGLRSDDLARINPSVDAESLEALGDHHPAIRKIHHFAIIDKLITGFLPTLEDIDPGLSEVVSGATPKKKSSKGKTKTKKDLSRKGITYNIDPDGRVRTHLSQASETGRHKSSEVNLQNLYSKQDALLKEIVGKDGFFSLRSCFVAEPGRVIVQSDYKTAEVFTLARLSGCEKLVRDAYADCHARGAVKYLGVEKWAGYDEMIPPTKEWRSKFKSKRDGAKALIFGVPYQLGAKSLARKIAKDTKGALSLSADEGQALIDAYYADYPEVRAYVNFCKACVTHPGYLETPFGRRRRFRATDDDTLLAAMERESVNFPIQSSVADILNTALFNLHAWRKINAGKADYRLLLPVHDAVLLSVSVDSVKTVVDEVLPECMQYGAVCPSWSNMPGAFSSKPFNLDIDTDVILRWSVEPTRDELSRSGCSADIAERFGK